MKSFSQGIGKFTLRSPKIRFFLCIVALILGVICVVGNPTDKFLDEVLDLIACVMFFAGAALALSVLPFRHTLFRKK